MMRVNRNGIEFYNCETNEVDKEKSALFDAELRKLGYCPPAKKLYGHCLLYTSNDRDIDFLGLSLLKISMSTNDLFYVSTIKQERGLNYPFARTFYLSIQANF